MLSRFSCVWLFATPWVITSQAPLSMGFSRQETLEWVAVPFSRGSSRPRNRTPISALSCIAGRFFTHWAAWEAPKCIVGAVRNFECECKLDIIVSMANVLSLIILWWCRRISLFIGAIHWNIWGKGLHWALFLCDKSPQKSSYIFSLFFYLDSAPLGSSCELCWGPLCACDQQPTGWTALLLGRVWWLAGVTRTLSLSHQQVSPDLFTGRGKVPRKMQRERKPVKFLETKPQNWYNLTGDAFSQSSHKVCSESGGGCLCITVGKAEKSHCKGPGCGEGKTVVICANYHKDGWVFLQLYWNVSIGLKAF